MAILDLQLTNTGDVNLDLNSNPKWLYGKPAAEQMIKVALSIWKNEWFRQRERGVDWPGVLQNRLTTDDLKAEIIRALRLLSIVDDVVDVLIQYDRAKRMAEIFYVVKADNEVVTGQEFL